MMSDLTVVVESPDGNECKAIVTSEGVHTFIPSALIHLKRFLREFAVYHYEHGTRDAMRLTVDELQRWVVGRDVCDVCSRAADVCIVGALRVCFDCADTVPMVIDSDD